LEASQRSPRALRFDAYTIDLHKCTLRRGNEVLALRPKAFDVLRHLAQNPGRVVGKQELLEAVWARHIVTDDALVQCIRDVRQALSDHEHRLVKTVPRRGYLFCAEPSQDDAAAPVPMHPAQTIDYCRTRDGVRIAMATVGQGLPLIRPPTWFNHLEYDWHVQFRGALYRFLADRVQLIRYDGRRTGCPTAMSRMYRSKGSHAISKPWSMRCSCAGTRCWASPRGRRWPSRMPCATPSGSRSWC